MEEKLFYLEHYSNKRVNQTITNACRTEEKPVIKELQVFCLPVLTSWFCSFDMPSSVFVGFGLCLLGSLFCFVFLGGSFISFCLVFGFFRAGHGNV